MACGVGVCHTCTCSGQGPGSFVPLLAVSSHVGWARLAQGRGQSHIPRPSYFFLSLVDDEEEATVTADTSVVRTVVLPITGPATNVWDTSSLTSSILTYLDSRVATTQPPPLVAVMPATGGVNMAVSFPPGSQGTAGALTLLADAEPPLTTLVNALITATSDNNLVLGEPFAVTGDYITR